MSPEASQPPNHTAQTKTTQVHMEGGGGRGELGAGRLKGFPKTPRLCCGVGQNKVPFQFLSITAYPEQQEGWSPGKRGLLVEGREYCSFLASLISLLLPPF